MGYVIALIVVLLLVVGAVTFFVLNAAKAAGRAAPEDPGAEGTPAGIAAPDESPLGDTTEHAGEQQEGQTTDEPGARRRGRRLRRQAARGRPRSRGLLGRPGARVRAAREPPSLNLARTYWFGPALAGNPSLSVADALHSSERRDKRTLLLIDRGAQGAPVSLSGVSWAGAGEVAGGFGAVTAGHRGEGVCLAGHAGPFLGRMAPLNAAHPVAGPDCVRIPDTIQPTPETPAPQQQTPSPTQPCRYGAPTRRPTPPAPATANTQHPR